MIGKQLRMHEWQLNALFKRIPEHRIGKSFRPSRNKSCTTLRKIRNFKYKVQFHNSACDPCVLLYVSVLHWEITAALWSAVKPELKQRASTGTHVPCFYPYCRRSCYWWLGEIQFHLYYYLIDGMLLEQLDMIMGFLYEANNTQVCSLN